MNAASYDIANILEAESALGLTIGTNLFIGREPDKIESCVVLFDTPSYRPETSLSAEEYYEYCSLQIRVRSNEYLTAFNTADEIKTFLNGQANITVDEVVYTSILCSTPPALLDWDNGKVRFIINFEIQRR